MIGANGKRRAIWLFSFRYIAGKFSHFVDVPIQIYDKALSTVMDHFECKSTSKPTYYSVTAFIVLYLRGNYSTSFAMCVKKKYYHSVLVASDILLFWSQMVFVDKINRDQLCSGQRREEGKINHLTERYE